MKIKSIVSTLLAAALTAALAVPAFAASGINDAEARILDALDTEVNGIAVLDTAMGEDAYGQVRAFLNRDDVDLDDVAANTVITEIWAAAAYAEANDITSAADLDLATVGALSAYVDNIYSALGIDFDDETGEILSVNPIAAQGGGSGSGSGSTAVKATGADFTATWAVLALVVAATAGCAVFVKKSRVEI